MSEVTKSTNVDNGKKDKYLEDIAKGTPSIDGFAEHIEDKNKDDVYEIAVDPRMVGKAVCDTIRDFGELNILVHTVSREEFNKIKTTLKARQAAQEKAMKDKHVALREKEQEK